MTWLTGLAQATATLFWTLTAFYAVIASQTFAYEQFLRPDLVPAVGVFARHHSLLCAGVLVVYLSVHALAGTTCHTRARVALYVLASLWTVVAGVLFALPPLAALVPGRIADVLVFAALLPLFGLAAVDFGSADAADSRPPLPRHGADFVACAAAAVVAFCVSAIIGMSRDPVVNSAGVIGLATSLTRHLAMFTAFFLLLTAARAVAALAANRLSEAAALATLLGGALFLVLWQTLLPPLVPPGPQLVLIAAAFAAAITAVIIARGMHASHRDDDPVHRVTAALAPRVAMWRGGLVGWLVLVALLARLIASASDTADWNFVIADVGVVLTWLLVLTAMLRFVKLEHPGRPGVLFALAGLVLMLNVGWNSVVAAGADTRQDTAASSDDWTRRDPAARLLANAMTAATPATDGALFELLQRHTNIPASVNVAPVDVSLGMRAAEPGYRPHIFLFVVDSLRRDYVGAYNDAVWFTPAIDAFARDSVVFKRAFTRYGATGLSVPSIWTGGMLLHKQYVTPFHPMNTLAKLLASEEYMQWIAMDNIMEVILPPSHHRERLDAHRAVKDFRFCGTLNEIHTKLAARAPSNIPVFAYALPQDIHVSAIARESGTAVDENRYDGFYAPVASRVRRFDRCFGTFVEQLKASGSFDNSIIILTSDHGDSLGEGGRMGHAYTLFPEIVQIPLIVHLPARFRAGVDPENESAVFSTDITPTLYALLGVRPERPRSFYGRPLYRARGARPRAAESDAPVVAASYGAVYGALVDQQRSLYVLDTINVREHAFSLDGSGPGVAIQPTPDMRQQGQRAIRATVEDIADFYRFAPHP
jgi:Sulfatase